MMRTSWTIYQQLLAVLFIASTIAPLPVARGQARQGEPINITFGQPNI